MRSRRATALLVSLPILGLGLMGAGSPPPPATLTYHGAFTAVQVSGDCTGGTVDGVWDVRVPDRAGGTAMVFVQIRIDGRLHAWWRFPFDLSGPATPDAMAANLELFGTDHLSVALDDGALTYVLEAPSMGCTATFTGPQLS